MFAQTRESSDLLLLIHIFNCNLFYFSLNCDICALLIFSNNCLLLHDLESFRINQDEDFLTVHCFTVYITIRSDISLYCREIKDKVGHT